MRENEKFTAALIKIEDNKSLLNRQLQSLLVKLEKAKGIWTNVYLNEKSEIIQLRHTWSNNIKFIDTVKSKIKTSKN